MPQNNSSEYALTSIEDVEWPDVDQPLKHLSLTDSLGCSDNRVSVYRLTESGSDRKREMTSLTLSSSREHLVVPVGDSGELSLEDSTVGPNSIAFVPVRTSCTIDFVDNTTAFVISATATAEHDKECTVLSIPDLEYTVPETSAIATARLTRRLGCRGMKVNARVLESGQEVPYHTEGDQEELFVPLTSSTSMRIDDGEHQTPPGTVVRVAPNTPRSAHNDGESDSYWVMVGAPPTGGPNEWDPGATILE